MLFQSTYLVSLNTIVSKIFIKERMKTGKHKKQPFSRHASFPSSVYYGAPYTIFQLEIVMKDENLRTKYNMCYCLVTLSVKKKKPLSKNSSRNLIKFCESFSSGR